MKKKLLIVVIIIAGLITIALLYIQMNRMPVEVQQIKVLKADKDTYTLIKSKTEKEKFRNNTEDYYDVFVTGAFSNDSDLTYVSWICYSKKNYDNKKVWLFYRREGASVVYPHSVEEGIGLHMIIYAPDSSKEEIENFVKNELEIFALGKIMKNKKDTA